MWTSGGAHLAEAVGIALSRRQGISGEIRIAGNALSFCFHAIPDGKPVTTFLDFL
jgi:hypothetical protein